MVKTKTLILELVVPNINMVAERAISTLSFMAHANLVYLMIHWPQYYDMNRWALSMDYAVWVYNHTPK